MHFRSAVTLALLAFSFSALADETKDALEKTGACDELRCHVERALADPKTYKICAGEKNEKLRKIAFCDKSQTVVNPFAVSAANGGTAECRAYFLLLARRQAKEVLDSQTFYLSDLGDHYFVALGGNLISLEKDCTFEKLTGDGTKLEDYRDALKTKGSASGARYCASVFNGCRRLGGEMKDAPVVSKQMRSSANPEDDSTWAVVKGTRKACVVDGLILDESCFEIPEKMLKGFKNAFKALSSTAVPCLRKIGGGAEKAAKKLEETLSGKEPNTRLCCGDAGCKSDRFPEMKPSAEGFIAQSVSGNAPYGTIIVGDKGLELEPSTMRSSLFHEYLHRIGMCRHPYHNDLGPRKVYVPCKGPDICKTSVPKKEDQDPQYEYLTEDELKKLEPELHKIYGNKDEFWKDKPDAPDKKCACLKKLPCPGGNLLTSPRAVMDPVYACEQACFGHENQRFFTGEYEKKVKAMCSENADRGDFLEMQSMEFGKTLCQ